MKLNKMDDMGKYLKSYNNKKFKEMKTSIVKNKIFLKFHYKYTGDLLCTMLLF